MVSKDSLRRFVDSTGKIMDLMSPNEHNAHAIMEWIMPDLDPDELKVSLTNYYKYLETKEQKYVAFFDPVPGLFQKYSVIQKHQKVAKKVGLTWWPYIEKYVANPEYVLDMVGRKKPAIKKMLSTPLGDSYIQYFTKRLYEFFDLWFHEFPRWHTNCGGLIMYRLINKKVNAWGWSCRKCNMVIPSEELEEKTYKERKYKITGGSYDGGQENTQQNS
jgi:hypothetical protein